MAGERTEENWGDIEMPSSFSPAEFAKMNEERYMSMLAECSQKQREVKNAEVALLNAKRSAQIYCGSIPEFEERYPDIVRAVREKQASFRYPKGGRRRQTKRRRALRKSSKKQR
jgi:hypothetical protein